MKRILLLRASILTIIIFAVTLTLSTPSEAKPYEQVDFKNVDEHALNTPKSAEKSVSKLAKYLLKEANTDLEKARAIFIWITDRVEYDVKSYFSGRIKNQAPKRILKKKVAVCDGYSQLFKAIADEMGLETIKISGYAKGFGYQGNKRIEGPPNHAWNVVKIDGQWHFIDSTWAAGTVGYNRKYNKEFNEHYFLTPPDEFIGDHWTNDTKWQLLDEPISRDEYEKLLRPWPSYYKSGIKIDSHRYGYIETKDTVEISILVEPGVTLMTTLHNGKEYIDKAFIFTKKKDDKYILTLAFPKKGIYKFSISSAREVKRNGITYFDSGIDYVIKAKKGIKSKKPFPEVFSKFHELNGELFEPAEGLLKKNKKHSFKLKLPGASSVVINNNGEKTYLESDEDGTFEGEVELKKGEVTVVARYDRGNGYSETSLLKYEVR